MPDNPDSIAGDMSQFYGSASAKFARQKAMADARRMILEQVSQGMMADPENPLSKRYLAQVQRAITFDPPTGE